MIFIDEFQDYVSGATADFGELLAQARGLGVGLSLAPFSAVGEVLFFPWWGDVEVVEDGSLGGGEAVESDAVVGVGESESLERGEGVSAGGYLRSAAIWGF